MDKIKKYMRENERNLSTDGISEKVWDNVEQAITPGRNAFSGTLERWLKAPLLLVREGLGAQRGTPISRFKLAIAVFLPVLLIFSCTYRVDRTETIGDIVRFSISSHHTAALQQAKGLQSGYGFLPLPPAQASEKGLSSFIAFIKKEKKNSGLVKNKIESIPTLSQLAVTPVKTKINESLFSALAHKAFNVHIDARRPGKREQEKDIKSQLQREGLNGIEISIGEDRVLQLTVPFTEPLFVQDTTPRDSTPIVIVTSKARPVRSKEKATEPDTKAVEIAVPKEFMITPLTTPTALDQIGKEIRQHGYVFSTEKSTFADNQISRLTGYIGYKERKQNNFDMPSFISFKIRLDEKEVKGAYRLEIIKD
jgi:hypothetical protein